MTALLSIFTAGMVGCGDPEPQPAPSGDGVIALNPASLEFEAAGETKTVNVTEGKNWNATTTDGWLTVSESEGSFTVTAAENNSDGRTGSVTVKNADDTKTVTVTQKAGGTIVVPSLTVDPAQLDFTAEGGTREVEITSELSWNATVPATVDWIEVEPSAPGFSVIVEQNTLSTGRNAVITVENGETAKAVTVTQQGAVIDPSLTVDPAELSFGAGRSSATVSVTSRLEWTATVPVGIDWIEITQSQNDFTVSVIPNSQTGPRNATITVGNGQTTKTVTVTQQAGDMVIPKMTGDGIIWSMRDMLTPGMFYYAVDLYSSGITTSGEDKTIEGTGDWISLDVFTEPGDPAVLPSGTYPVSVYMEPGVVYAGARDNGEDTHSWYHTYLDGAVNFGTPFRTGEVTVSNNDGVYTISFDVRDHENYRITGSYEGRVRMIY